jgi:hypothetical protein
MKCQSRADSLPSVEAKGQKRTNGRVYPSGALLRRQANAAVICQHASHAVDNKLSRVADPRVPVAVRHWRIKWTPFFLG